MKNIFYCFFVFILSCNKQVEKKDLPQKYDMYESSEMALLMQQMYNYHEVIKQEIVNNKPLQTFPEAFLKIHTAELSDFKSRNENFQNFSKLFINSEKELFNPEAKTDLKNRYNNTIQVCISCHQTECTGPIPKIKKLFIK